MAIRFRSSFSKHGGLGSALEGVSSALSGSFSMGVGVSGSIHSIMQDVTAALRGNQLASSNYQGVLSAALSGVSGLWFGGAPLPEGSWLLQPNHYVPAKKPGELIYPRPDSECNTWARHRKAYVGDSYEVPVGWAFGSWPFRYEIVSGPTGMIIGETLGSANYGVVSWTPTPADIGIDYTVTVRIYDQEYGRGSTPNDVSWTVRAGTDPSHFTDGKGFIFIDPVNGHAWNDPVSPGTGTRANPFLTSRDWYRDDPYDATFYGYHVIWRGGTHYLYFDPNAGANPGNGEINHPYKSMVWYNVPGDPLGPANLNFSGAKAICQESVDVFVGNLGIEHSRRMSAQHFFFFYSKSMTLNGTAASSSPGTLGYRHTFWRNRWSYHYPSDKDRVNYPVRPTGPTAGENTAAVWTIGWPSNGGVTKHRRFFWYFADNAYNNFCVHDPDTGYALWEDNGCPPAELSQAHKVLVERNRTDGYNDFSSVTYHKTTSSQMCYRANYWWLPGVDESGTWETNISEAYEDLRDDLKAGDIEWCWNKVKTAISTTNGNAYTMTYPTPSYPWSYVDGNIWVYRNTIHGDIKGQAVRVVNDPTLLPALGNLPQFENNVLITNDADGFYKPTTINIGTLKLRPDGDGVYFDVADGHLLTADRGLKGHEVF